MTIQSMDTQLLLFINQGLVNPFFDGLMPALTFKGYLLVFPFFLAMLLHGSSRKNDHNKTFVMEVIWSILIACCAAYLAGGVEHWMKESTLRVRPCCAIEGIRLLLPCPKSYSMPSGHAISSFAFATPLFYLSRRYMNTAWRIYPLILAALIAFSRLYLGVHYPSDVIVGATAGTAIGMVLSISYKAIVTVFRN